MKINSQNVRFILVEPKSPGNIGAAARAIKTMGFDQLVLVNPCDYQVPETRWLAHASEDILEKARVFSSLREALQDVHFAVATTNRTREYQLPIYSPEQIAQKLIPVSGEHQVALVFGREQSGLTNDEIRLCHALSTIPAAITHPSLNLAQAVMLYAYSLFNASFAEDKHYQWNYATYEQKEGVYQHLQRSLEQVNFVPIDSWEKFLMRFRRMFDRALPEVRDVKLMHKILQAFDEYVKYDGLPAPNQKARKETEK